MTHYLSCGHELLEDEEGNELFVSLATKSYSCNYDGLVNAIHYATYCSDCAKEIEEDGLVLHNEQEEMDWLKED